MENVFVAQKDSTLGGDPFVQQLVSENARLKSERDRLVAINARMMNRIIALRSGVEAVSVFAKEKN